MGSHTRRAWCATRTLGDTGRNARSLSAHASPTPRAVSKRVAGLGHSIARLEREASTTLRQRWSRPHQHLPSVMAQGRLLAQRRASPTNGWRSAPRNMHVRDDRGYPVPGQQHPQRGSRAPAGSDAGRDPAGDLLGRACRAMQERRCERRDARPEAKAGGGGIIGL